MKEYISSGVEYKGYVTKSILKLKLSWKYHLAFLVCETIFSYTQIAYPSLRSQIQLFVFFKPNFIHTKNHSHISLNLGAVNQSIHIETIANPLPISYKWFYKHHLPPISVIDDTMFIQSVEHDIMQQYELVASNKLGKSNLIVYIDVTYGPKIIGERVLKHRVKSKISELECIVEANPPPEFSTIKWIFLGRQNEFDDVFNETNQFNYFCNQGQWKTAKLKLFVKCRLISEKRVSSSLIIYDTSPEDVGTYICSASDNSSHSENKTIELIALSIPHFISIPLFTKIAQIDKSKSEARTLIYSEPEPSVILYIHMKFNMTISFTSEIKQISWGFYIIISEINWSNIHGIEKIYWEAKNKFGISQLPTEVVPESSPDSPFIDELKVIPPNLMFLKITQTFDGGYPQTFEIFWREAIHNITKRNKLEIPGNYSKKYITITIPDINRYRNYEIQVCSRNVIHGRCKLCPTKILFPDGRQSFESSTEDRNENSYEQIFQFNLKIIIAVAGFVFGLILLAVSIIILLFKRKRSQATPDLRSNIDLNFKYGNDLLIPNISNIDSKSEYHSINSMENSLIPLYKTSIQCSQSKV